MRIEKLATRIAAAPRGVGIALVLLTAVVSPGFIRAIPDDGALRPSPDHGGAFASRPIAVFALGCAEGVFTPACLRFVARVTEALEADSRIAGEVRSLTRTRVVTNDRGSLGLESLVARIPTTDQGMRALRARLVGDPAQARLFLGTGERETRIYAELDPQLSSERAHALAESLRQRFERAPGLLLSARSLGEGASAGGHSFSLAWVLALAALSVVLAPGSWRTSAVAATAALAFAVFAHGLLRLLGEPERLLGGLLPALLCSSAFATSYALVQRAREARGSDPDVAAGIAEALAELGPAFAVAAVMTVTGAASCLALSPDVPLARGLCAAAGLAAALVVYPLGVTIAALRVWPLSSASAAGELSSSLRARIERGLARPHVVACGAALSAALVSWGAIAFAPAADALRVRTIVLDSGTRSGALDPAFLERVQAFQRSAERERGVVASTSWVDTIVAPAYRALHDGDPAFATVPPTRSDVESALRPWLRDERRTVSRQIDAERRRVAVELVEAPGELAPLALRTRPLAGVLLSLLGVAGLGALALGSARGGVLCALPGAIAAPGFLVLARMIDPVGPVGAAALAPLTVGVTAAFALLIAVRVRSLLRVRAEPAFAVARSMRESASTIASAALAGSAFVAIGGIAVDASPTLIAICGLFAPLGAAATLSTLPAALRRSAVRAFGRDEREREAVQAAKR